MLIPRRFYAFVNAVFVLFVSGIGWQAASADLVTYTDRTQFDLFAGAFATEIDFESQPTGNIPSGTTIDGVMFTYNFGFVSLRVIDSYDTTSGVKSLGTNDVDILQDGDDISFSFDPQRGFGLYIISADLMLDDDFRLTTGTTTASFDASEVQLTLGDGSKVWFLGILSDDAGTFTSIELTTHGGGGAFLYNLDDVVIVSSIPEPSGSLIAILTGLCFVRRIRRRSLKSPAVSCSTLD